MTAPTAGPSHFRTIAYAAFLACSWTWCIGMYLPVILLRDFGPWSFVVFAVPNCLGAAAMGVLLWRRDASERFLAAHLPACRVFSLVTVAFQLWFLVSCLLREGAPAWLAGAVVGGAVLGAGAARPRFTVRAVASFVAFLASLLLVGAWAADAGVSPAAPIAAPSESALELICLAPVCVLGFALSPYLDLTFHAARQSVPGGAGSRAFLIGFLLLFPLIIGLTFLYGQHAVAANPAAPLAAMSGLVLAHMMVQLSFTIGVHYASLDVRRTGHGRWLGIGVGVLVLAAVLPLIQRWLIPTGFSYAGLTFFEVTYRLFMAFYGLVFPAYVLICGVSADGIRARADRRALTVFAIALLAAAPCYWVGFIQRETVWLVPGVLIWVLAKAFVPRQSARSA